MNLDEFLKLTRKEAKEMKTVSDHIAPLHNPTPLYKYIQQSLNQKEIPENLRPSLEWESHLSTWFGYVRLQCHQISNGNENVDFNSIQRYIESNELPKMKFIGGPSISEIGIAYFAKRDKEFSKVDLFWLFSFLSKIITPLKPEMCENLQKILVILKGQIISLGKNPFDDLIPYLNVNVTLIKKVFHQT